jgi:hypothetical protein
MVKQSSLRRKRSSKRKTSVRRKRSSKRNTSTRRRRSSKRKTSVRRRRSSKRKTSRRRRRSKKRVSKRRSRRKSTRKQQGGMDASLMTLGASAGEVQPPAPPTHATVRSGAGSAASKTSLGSRPGSADAEEAANEINNLIAAVGRRPKNYHLYIDRNPTGAAVGVQQTYKDAIPGWTAQTGKDYNTLEVMVIPTCGGEKKYGDGSECGYNDPIFKIITEEQIENIEPKVNDIYNRLHSEITGSWSSKMNKEQRSILKLTLPENAKIIYFGDFHSDIHSLEKTLNDLKDVGGYFDEHWRLTHTHGPTYLVLMGDLVDRGPYGVEIMYLIYNLFIINNTEEYKVIILNGNHEEDNVYNRYGFGTELAHQFPHDPKKSKEEDQTANKLKTLIKRLPVGLFIKSEEAAEEEEEGRSADDDETPPSKVWYQFCHGGISEAHENNEIYTFLYPSSTKAAAAASNINKHQMIAISTLHVADGFLWSDFSHNQSTSYPRGHPIRHGTSTGRAASLTYHRDGIQRVNNKLGIKTIISGHQDNVNLGVVLDMEFANDGSDPKFIWPTPNWAYPESGRIALMTEKNIPYEAGTAELPAEWLAPDDSGELPDVVPGSTTINMNHVSALTMSAATIAKELPVSIYGILNLSDDTSFFKWLASCNSSKRFSLPENKYNVPGEGKCPAWNSDWATLAATEKRDVGTGKPISADS